MRYYIYAAFDWVFDRVLNPLGKPKDGVRLATYLEMVEIERRFGEDRYRRD